MVLIITAGSISGCLSQSEEKISDEEEDLTTDFNGEGDDKVAVFGGGSSTSISNEQFDQLKNKLN